MICASILLGLLLADALAGASAVRFEDLPSEALAFLPGIGSAVEFELFRRQLVRDLNDRLSSGEQDALVYYVLQGRRFTRTPSVEPVLGARDFVKSGDIPAVVRTRIRDFVQACQATGLRDERLSYFCRLSQDEGRIGGEFRRAMRFLYEKEVKSLEREGSDRRDFVASLYRTRGLSSDSAMDANFPVYLALKRLAADRKLRLNRILIVGPGLDFAPRTGLDDSLPPQSLQPYAIADAVLQLGLSSREHLRIHCVDINPHVVERLRAAQSEPPALSVRKREGPEEYSRYHEEFGRAIGTVDRPDPVSRIIRVSAAVARRITADRLDVVTERDESAPGYDLAVATNVLLYLGDAELALALSNLRSMLRGGGYFLHNESRGSVEAIGRAVNLPVIDARLIRLLENDRRAIYDTQVVHRRSLD
ncbi:MAG TPA: hypothetical protein VL285_07955 [Bryobacteraceae bacterium]|nr:hypothetical protein [Bryobacteraceae bacterium]